MRILVTLPLGRLLLSAVALVAVGATIALSVRAAPGGWDGAWAEAPGLAPLLADAPVGASQVGAGCAPAWLVLVATPAPGGPASSGTAQLWRDGFAAGRLGAAGLRLVVATGETLTVGAPAERGMRVAVAQADSRVLAPQAAAVWSVPAGVRKDLPVVRLAPGGCP